VNSRRMHGEEGIKMGIPLADEDAFLRRNPDHPSTLPVSGKRMVALLLVKSTLLFLAVVALYLLYEYGKHLPVYTVQADNITIETGDYLNPKDIRSLIHKHFPDNLITLDIDELRSRIESVNWVREVTIRKVMPDQLRIVVREKRPVGVARTDRLWLFDTNGDFLSEYQPARHDIDCPVLIGLMNDGDPLSHDENRERIRRYLEFVREIDGGETGLSGRLSEVDLADLADVVVIPLEGAPRVHLGHENFRKRLENYFQVIDMAREENGPISEIDMRYDDKVIVKPYENL